MPCRPTCPRATWPAPRPTPASASLGKLRGLAFLRRRGIPRAQSRPGPFLDSPGDGGAGDGGARRARDDGPVRRGGRPRGAVPAMAGRRGPPGGLPRLATAPGLPPRSYLTIPGPDPCGLWPPTQAVRPPAPSYSSQDPCAATPSEDSLAERLRAEAARPLPAAAVGGARGGGRGLWRRAGGRGRWDSRVPALFKLVDFCFNTPTKDK